LHSDNPAARLLKILEDGKKIDPNTKCRKAWHRLLDVEESNPALLMSRLGKLMEQPDLIIRDIKDNYPKQNSSHNHWSSKVNTAFMQQNLNGAWSEFIAHIDAHTIDYLSMSADLLDMKSSTQLMSEADINNIRSKVEELLNEAIDADIDMDFKKYVVRYLRKIVIAIDEYRISGAIPISESIESAFGHTFIDEKYRVNISSTEFGSKFLSALAAVASAVTIAVGLPQLPDTFQYLLTGPT
jgi:hypothetical protein